MPARSVEAVVADMVEKAREGARESGRSGEADFDAAWLVRVFGYADAPALVEALAEIADLDQDNPPRGGWLPEDAARMVGWQDGARIARAALGGEQVQGRAELEAEQFRVCGSDGYESDKNGLAVFTDVKLAADYAAECDEDTVDDGTKHWVERRLYSPWERVESSSPTPTTPKGAE